MRLPSFSRIGLAKKCPAAVCYPGVHGESEAADRGIARHAFNAQRKTLGRNAALAELPAKHRKEAAALDTSPIDSFFAGMDSIRSEVAYAYDPDTDTARELGVNVNRSYSAHGANQEEQFCGSTDDIATDGTEIRLLDLKGRGKADPAQIESQAVAASRTLGIENVTAGFGYAQDDGSIIVPTPFKYEAMDLDMIAGNLRDLKKRVKRVHLIIAEGKTPELYEGEHCTYCPAQRYCPAKVSLIRAASAGKLDIPSEVKALTTEQRSSAWLLVKKYKPLFEQLEKALKSEAAIEPIPLPFGYELTATPGRETIDSEIALEVLTREMGQDIAQRAIEPTVTKKSLKAIGDVDELVGLIRDAGGVKMGAPIVREVKAK